MARTPSNMIPLRSKAAEFTLYDTVSDAAVSLNNIKGAKGTVLYFICNHCPFVIHVNKELVAVANEYQKKGISFVAISSNDVNNYPQDSPELMKKVAIAQKYPFPYLFDKTQEVALSYEAACTPDIFVYNGDLELAYRGQLDDSRPGNGVALTGSDLRYALDCLVANKPNERKQKPSIGCNIKWKK